MKKKVRWSKYCRVLKDDNYKGYIVLYHILNMELAYFKEKHFNMLAEGLNSSITKKEVSPPPQQVYEITNLKEEKNLWKKPGINKKEDGNLEEAIGDLKSKGFLVEDDENEDDMLLSIRKSIEENVSIKNLRLLITENCNLGCDYCQIEKNLKSTRQINMSREIALKAVKLFKDNSKAEDLKTIIFTGGEPILNMEVIREVVTYCSREMNNCRFIIFTNGTLIDKNIAGYFKNNNVFVLISLDGPGKVHDITRKTKMKKSCYNEVIKAIEVLKAVGSKIGISAVVGGHNIDILDTEVFDFFQGLKINSLGVNILHYLLDSDIPHQIDINSYADKLIKIFQRARKNGIFIENINRVIAPFINKEIRGRECSAQGKGITVMPDGTVGTCKTLLAAGVIGCPIDKFSLNDNEMFSRWKKRTSFSLEQCDGCMVKSLCGSGCTYDAFVLNKTINSIDDRTCVITKRFFHFLVWDLLNILREKYNDEFLYLIPTVEERKFVMQNIHRDNKLKETVGH